MPALAGTLSAFLAVAQGTYAVGTRPRITRRCLNPRYAGEPWVGESWGVEANWGGKGSHASFVGLRMRTDVYDRTDLKTWSTD